MALLLIASTLKVPWNPSSHRNIRSIVYMLTNQKRSCTLPDLFLLLFDMLPNWEISSEAASIRISHHECLQHIKSKQKCRNERRWKIFIRLRFFAGNNKSKTVIFFIIIKAVNSCLFAVFWSKRKNNIFLVISFFVLKRIMSIGH